MARALVTGASGFIGAQLVAALADRGDDVRCLVRPTSQVDELVQYGARMVLGDVTEPDTLPAAIADVDAVYHLAGLTRANGLAAYCRVNEDGVRNVVEACARRTTPPVAIVVSSLAAAGPMHDRNQLRTENDPPQPVSHYGQSKRAGEVAAEAKAANVPITIVRPPIVLGPGDKTGFLLFRGIRRLRSYLVLGLRRRVSAVHVADLAAGLIAAAQCGERLPSPAQQIHESQNGHAGSLSSVTSGTGYYYFAADEHPLFNELGRMIACSLERPRAWAIHVPVATSWIIGGTGEAIGRLTGRPRYLNLDRPRELTAGHWTCSPEKARRTLGFKPAAPLQKRIEQTAQWYFQHGWL